MRSIHKAATVPAALALMLGMAACGTGDDEPSASPPDTMSQTPEESAEPTSSEAPSAVQPTGTGDPFEDARTAAAHMPGTAATLAAGFVTALDLPGDADSDAATLRANLTALLQEHVYLAGIAVATAYAAGPDSPEFDAAAATLDENSVDLSEAVGSLAGDENAAAFLDLWRTHIGYFVDYAVAVAGQDEAGADKATAELTQYTKDAGAFFDKISDGHLPAATMTDALSMHVETLSAAIDDLAAGSPDAYDTLQQAAAHVSTAAGVIADGLVAATGMSGDPDDEASTLRTNLTQLLQEHVYLASIAVFTAYTADGGPDSEAFKAAAATLDGNSVRLSEAVGSLAGDDKGAAFLDLWRTHIGYFVDYAVAIAGGDDAAAQQALVDLDDYRGDAGDFFATISDGALPADAIAEGLAMHVQTLAGAIDSLDEALN
ncbi:hypothetical protein [Pseudactinotalea sp. HY158]|uniref:hypothetical protein n=1 Tax=Pseudactinotalea sp. HY158 TaxID=2654547 RepID=UPI00129D0082|nr:hypothetical protein [Pseudactinotalea sp. HY158]QGH70191.1 hypothetical protein GCE65_12275 [Pseudactinotalea sp. HY158]